MKIEVFAERKVQDDGSRYWRWHVLDGGRITADSGESYTRRRDAVRAVKRHIARMRKADESQIHILDIYTAT
jgi:hypothetical protein